MPLSFSYLQLKGSIDVHAISPLEFLALVDRELLFILERTPRSHSIWIIIFSLDQLCIVYTASKVSLSLAISSAFAVIDGAHCSHRISSPGQVIRCWAIGFSNFSRFASGCFRASAHILQDASASHIISTDDTFTEMRNYHRTILAVIAS